MIILDATTKSLQFKLSGTVTANQLPFSASYVDSTGTATTPGEQDGVSNNTTAVNAVSAPAASTQRLVKNIVIQNADTAAATVTIIYNNNTTLRNIVVATLAVGDQLTYEDGYGWASIDKNGNFKTSGSGSSGGTVSSVSVVSANGLAGSVANATTTPAITISTSVTGVLLGNGTAISAATAGTDYSAGTSALSTGILKSTTSTGALSIAVAADFPTLNQSTTGNAATVTTNANLTGAVTSVGNATSISNSAVTYAKIQNVTNNTILGNTSGSAAAPSEITLPLSGSNGGTGVSNGSSTITIGGNVAFSGAYTFTGTLSANTSITFPASGTLAILGANTFSGLQTFSPSSGIAGYITAGAIEEAVYSNGNSGTSKAVNLDNGNLQSLTITGAVTVTQTTPTHPGKYTLIITQDGTGHVYSLSGIKWVGGTAPTYSTAASKIDIISIVYDGTNYYGMAGIAFA